MATTAVQLLVVSSRVTSRASSFPPSTQLFAGPAWCSSRTGGAAGTPNIPTEQGDLLQKGLCICPLCFLISAPRVTPASWGPGLSKDTCSVWDLPVPSPSHKAGPPWSAGIPKCHTRVLKRTHAGHLRPGGGWRNLTFPKSHLFFPVILAAHHRVEKPALRAVREGSTGSRVPSPHPHLGKVSASTSGFSGPGARFCTASPSGSWAWDL